MVSAFCYLFAHCTHMPYTLLFTHNKGGIKKNVKFIWYRYFFHNYLSHHGCKNAGHPVSHPFLLVLLVHPGQSFLHQVVQGALAPLAVPTKFILATNRFSFYQKSEKHLVFLTLRLVRVTQPTLDSAC